MANEVKVIDRGWKEIRKNLQKYAKGTAAAVGIQGDKAASDEHGGITNAELGAIHEYGTQDGRIPERSFLRSTILDEEQSVTNELKRIAAKLFTGKNIDGDLLLAGEGLRAKVLEKIKSGIDPELASREGTPLWDTGQLVNSITAAVVDPKEKRDGN